MNESIISSDEEILYMYRTVGKNVKLHRKKKEMSQLQLSYALGFKSVSLVSAAELASDGKHFNLEQLFKISKILEVDMRDLIALN